MIVLMVVIEEGTDLDFMRELWSYEQLLKEVEETQENALETNFLYTSGNAASPKGVLHGAHHFIESFAIAMERISIFADEEQCVCFTFVDRVPEI